MCSVISLDFEQQTSSYGRIFRCHSVLSFRGVADFLCVSSSLVNCKLAEISILLFFLFFYRCVFKLVSNSLWSLSSKAFINFFLLAQHLSTPEYFLGFLIYFCFKVCYFYDVVLLKVVSINDLLFLCLLNFEELFLVVLRCCSNNFGDF